APVPQAGPAIVAAPTPAILSASGPAALGVGGEGEIDVRIEVDDANARPLTASTSTAINLVDTIAVIVTISGDAIELVDPWMKTVDPPSALRPVSLHFAVRARAVGVASVAVQFMQGSAPLGIVRLSLTVSATAGAPDARTTLQAVAAAPAPDAKNVLSLFIEEQAQGDHLIYRYLLTWDAKQLRYADFASAPFLARAGGVSATPFAYVQSIYRRIVERALVSYDDIPVFKQEVQGIGVDMCRQLFSDELARLLWQQRDDLEHVWITSKEAYVPWELLVLKNPDGVGAKAIDDRHLAERRLLRSLRGRQGSERLALADWRYVLADFPEGSFPQTQNDLALFTDTLPQHGAHVEAIAPDPAQVLAALSEGQFDVFHLSGHGEATPERIEEATLILGDRRKPNGQVETIGVTPATVSAQADLTARHPIIFLNACETGRQAASLTDLGGWPKAFLDAGASAFVGTSWPVRDKPAAAFSRTFYEALLDHHTLADAAGEARAAAKKLGDASWLAYTVYGQPFAKAE
ncbi:MAG: CHAT domain-containing protein, partial [Vicinamibacterales bacterium]